MRWFKGSIPEAILAAKSKGAVFIVHVEGEDELSKQMAEVWEDTTISELCEKEYCVGLCLKAGSEPCAQFSQIYPVVCIPCTFFIGNNGVPLEVVGGHLEPREFYEKIQAAVEMHKGGVNTEIPPAEGASVQTDIVVTAPQATTPTDAQPTSGIPVINPPQKSEEEHERTGEVLKSESSQESASTGAAAAAPTKEELSDKMKKANELIEQKRIEKAEKEREKAKLSEIERRNLGQDLNKFKQMKADMEADEIKQARLKEKREAKLAKERVRQQIAQDRAERAAKYQKEKVERQKDIDSRAAAARQASEAAAYQADQTKMSHEDRKRLGTDSDSTDVKRTKWETARLQFRLPDGSAINHQFQSSETLQTARNFVSERVASLGRFSMCTSYPKKTFTNEDLSKTLLELQLAPSAAIIIVPGSSQIARPGGSSGDSTIFMWILWPFMAVWGFIYNILFGTAPVSAPSSTQPPEERITPQPGPSGTQSSSGRNRPKSSYGIRQRREGNMHRLSAEDDDEDRTTWNGNSTQQL